MAEINSFQASIQKEKAIESKIELAKKLKNSGTSEMDVIRNPNKYKNLF